MIQVLRAANRIASAWKNGGGLTREIAASPPGAGFDDFDWRVSMAEVRTDGPFSAFPHIDRVLTVLEGRLALDIEGRQTIELAPGAAPLAFPGDAPTVGRLLEGPVTDLNVMTRRGAACAHLSRADSPTELPATAGVHLIVALADRIRVHGDGGVQTLQRYDAILTDAPARIGAAAGMHALVILLTGAEEAARQPPAEGFPSPGLPID